MPGIPIHNGGIREDSAQRDLFGGAITLELPNRFQDVSPLMEVPDNQELLVDRARDESLSVEILELKADVADNRSASWFLRDMAADQGASFSGEDSEIEQETRLTSDQVPHLDPGIFKSMSISTMSISKGRQGADANNIVRCHVANFRARNVGTDILVTMWEPLYISAQSSSASVLGVGPTVPGSCMPAGDVFRRALATFQIRDWGLFNA